MELFNTTMLEGPIRRRSVEITDRGSPLAPFPLSNGTGLDMAAKKQAKLVPEMEIDGLGLLVPGTGVEHPTFGEGTVTGLALWESGHRTIGVEFPNYGVRWLVPEYARLRRRSD